VWHGRQTRFLGSIAPDSGTDSRVNRFVFATSDICRDCDRMMHGAWDLENFKRNPIFGFNHDMSKPPIGKVIEIAERNGKLTAPCASLTPVCEPILAMHHDGTMNAVSVAWRPIEWKWAKEPSRVPDMAAAQRRREISLRPPTCVL
jgi:hypothetical protein